MISAQRCSDAADRQCCAKHAGLRFRSHHIMELSIALSAMAPHPGLLRLRSLAGAGSLLGMLAVVPCLELPCRAQALPSRPSAPCAGGLCANGGFQNNGWGNGFQPAPGSWGPVYNAGNTTGTKNGIVTATQNGNGQITGTGLGLVDGGGVTTGQNNGQTSPTPSSGSNGVANNRVTTAAVVNAPARGASGFIFR